MTQPTSTSTLQTSAWIRKILFGLAVILLVFFCLAPALWILLTSFKVNADITAVPVVFFPKRFTLQHYHELFQQLPFFRNLFNSFFVSLISTIACLVIGAPAAYALARLRPFAGRWIQIGIILITLFPTILLFQGLLEMVRAAHLGNNYLALILPYTAINLPLTILVMKSFCEQLPRDLEDAARVDGYNTLQLLTQIVLPLTLPALVTTSILTFIFAWNEYIFALTFISQEEMKTVPVASAQLAASSLYEVPYGSIAAATVAGTIPLVLLVLIFQRQIIQGLTAGAVKG